MKFYKRLIRAAPYVRGAMKAYRGARRVASVYSGVKRTLGSLGGRSAKRGKRITAPTTYQIDIQNMYRRRRAPRRVRRRARREWQKFTYNLDKTQGMVSSVINNFGSYSTTPTTPITGCQQVAGISMYGMVNSTSASNFNNDLWRIYTDAFGVAPSSTKAADTLRFRSCVMDFLVKNTGASPMFLEVYHCMSRGQGESDPSYQWELSANMEGGAGDGVATTISSITAYKVTPFDAPGFGSYWYVKKRTKFYISAGNSISWQIRDAKNYIITGQDLMNGKAKRGVTEGVILVGYGADLDAWATNSNIGVPTAATYDVSCVKTYHWTKTEDTTDVLGMATFS